jgi:hypothetical protein
MIHLSTDQARQYGIDAAKRKHKYRAIPTVVDGIRFDSKREATRYGWLRYREKLGEIRDLQLQVKYSIDVVNIETGEITHVAEYRADFVYVECASGKTIVSDAKGFSTPLYKLKRKLVEAQHNVRIEEV